MAETTYPSSATVRFGRQLALQGGVNEDTLTGTFTMSRSSATYQKLDPGGAARNVLLPTALPSFGPFLIENTADAAVEILTVKNAAGTTTVTTIRAGEACWFIYDIDADAWVAVGKSVVSLVPGASTAAAGSVTGDATVLPAGTSGIYPVTAADDTKGVRLHADDAVTGRVIRIANLVSNKILKVYPPTGGTINGAAANAAFSTASGAGVTLVCLSGAGNTWATA